jgi:hypothetical protein
MIWWLCQSMTPLLCQLTATLQLMTLFSMPWRVRSACLRTSRVYHYRVSFSALPSLRQLKLGSAGFAAPPACVTAPARHDPARHLLLLQAPQLALRCRPCVSCPCVSACRHATVRQQYQQASTVSQISDLRSQIDNEGESGEFALFLQCLAEKGQRYLRQTYRRRLGSRVCGC